MVIPDGGLHERAGAADDGRRRRSSPTRVMVVEDELLIGMDLVAMLEDWGYATSGPHRSPEEALRAIEEDAPDAAILDVNLGDGKTSMPVARVLHASGRPFAFLSGYDPSRYLSGDLAVRAPHLRKPVSENALRELVAQMVRAAACR